MFSFAVPAASADTMHKTDGSHTNRPFFRFKLDVRKSVFPPKDTLPRSVFCFFSSRKEIVPPSFLFRRKGSKRKSSVEKLFFAVPAASADTLHSVLYDAA